VTPASKEIERPLGQAGKPERPKRRFRVAAGTLGLLLAALAGLAASSAIALRERPFRDPARTAVTIPEASGMGRLPEAQAAAEPGASAAATPSDPATDGPSIVRVDPRDAEAGKGVIVIRDPSALGQNLRVAHLPDKALLEEGKDGPLPIRAADGRRPVDVYARPWSGARGARVAIVIGGLGVSQTGTQKAIQELPAEVTLAFAPNGNSIGRWMQAARRKGHEIVMQVPLEPFDYPTVDPGRHTLTVGNSAGENLENLRWTLSRTTNYTGIMNYMGGRFVADPGAMAPLMAELGKRGLLYLDDGSSARSVAAELALENKVPFAAGDTFIDADRDRGSILKKLDQLEATARARGFAVGTGSAFSETVEAVKSWVDEAKKRGIEIVPVSAVSLDPEKA